MWHVILLNLALMKRNSVSLAFMPGSMELNETKKNEKKKKNLIKRHGHFERFLLGNVLGVNSGIGVK